MADKDKKEIEKKPKEEEKEQKKDKKAAPEERKEGEGEETGAEGAAKKKLPLKLIIIVAVAALVVIGGALAALIFTGVLGGGKPAAESSEAAHGEKPAEVEQKADEHGSGGESGHGEGGAEAKKKPGSVFYDMGEIVVNLQAEGRRQTFLKLVVQLELENETDKPIIDNIKPRIIDNFQTYLRELRLDDLRGSSGLYRLREELLFRVTEAAYPVKVKDVLFQQMLVQ